VSDFGGVTYGLQDATGIVCLNATVSQVIVLFACVRRGGVGAVSVPDCEIMFPDDCRSPRLTAPPVIDAVKQSCRFLM
jgi:hypothetical protein